MKPVVSKVMRYVGKQNFVCPYVMAVSLGLLLLPGMVVAQDVGGVAGQGCGYLDNTQNLLNIISIVVVAIAIIISAVRIVFTRKRIAEVSSLLIGALLIGASLQVARMLMGSDHGSCSTAMLLNSVQLWPT